MKRDLDLIRHILITIEESTSDELPATFDGYTKDVIAYHITLLRDDAEYVTYDGRTRPDGNYTGIRLTWNGHEFLDAARDNTRWEKAKRTVAKLGGFTFTLLKEILVSLLKEELPGLL